MNVHNPKTILCSLDDRVRVTRGTLGFEDFYSVSVLCGKTRQFFHRSHDLEEAMRYFILFTDPKEEE